MNGQASCNACLVFLYWPDHTRPARMPICAADYFYSDRSGRSVSRGHSPVFFSGQWDTAGASRSLSWTISGQWTGGSRQHDARTRDFQGPCFQQGCWHRCCFPIAWSRARSGNKQRCLLSTGSYLEARPTNSLFVKSAACLPRNRSRRIRNRW